MTEPPSAEEPPSPSAQPPPLVLSYPKFSKSNRESTKISSFDFESEKPKSSSREEKRKKRKEKREKEAREAAEKLRQATPPEGVNEETPVANQEAETDHVTASPTEEAAEADAPITVNEVQESDETVKIKQEAEKEIPAPVEPEEEIPAPVEETAAPTEAEEQTPDPIEIKEDIPVPIEEKETSAEEEKATPVEEVILFIYFLSLKQHYPLFRCS